MTEQAGTDADQARAPRDHQTSAQILRRLRAAIAGALAGEEREAPLAALGLSGLSVADSGGHEVFRLGSVTQRAARRQLESGTASYELSIWPIVFEEQSASNGFLLDTM